MKTKILLFASAILMAVNLQAQAPEKFNYQGIARDSNGDALANQNIGVQISILNPANTALYVEQHTKTTNDFGLYTLQIGDGTPVSGTMGGVNWSGGTKKIKVEIDPNGGTSYTDLGTTELLSVPYALYAAESVWEQSGTDVSYSGGNVGIGTTNPTAPLQIEGATPTIGRFVQFAPTSIASSGDVLALDAPSSASGYAFIEANDGSDNVFVVQDDGSVEAVEFVSNPTGATQPGLILNENGSSNSWALTYASTDNLWFEHNGSLSSWIQPDGTYNSSDRRLKSNIVPMGGVLQKVAQIQVKRFSYKADENNKTSIGFIAQELRDQFPEMVERAGENAEGVNYLGVNYAGMSAVAIKAIQEQQKIIETLQQTVKQLQEELEELKN